MLGVHTDRWVIEVKPREAYLVNAQRSKNAEDMDQLDQYSLLSQPYGAGLRVHNR